MDTAGGGGEAWKKHPVFGAGQYRPPTTELKGQGRLFERSRISYLLGFVIASAFCAKAWQFSLAVLASDWAPCTQARVISVEWCPGTEEEQVPVPVCSAQTCMYLGSGNFRALTSEVPGTTSPEPKYFQTAIRQPGALQWLRHERVCLGMPPPAGWSSCVSPPGWLG